MPNPQRSITALQLDGVSYSRSSSEPRLFTDLSLAVAEGQWVCIAGENGCGKSTLVRLMNGLLQADEGSITVFGVPLDTGSVWEIRKRVGMIFSNPDHQFVGQTVAEDIVFGLENLCLPSDDIRRRLERYAELLQITHLLNENPAFLSGGQKQRAAIAAVLAMEPSIVILDEAASMLDECAKRELLEMLERMKESGQFTLISVTHDLEEMMAADRMIVLADGGIAGDGTPDQILRDESLLKRCRLETPYVLKLCRELRRQGIDVGEHLEEKELLRALWEYNSSMSLMSTGTEPRRV